jgi:hypothetical protein
MKGILHDVHPGTQARIQKPLVRLCFLVMPCNTQFSSNPNTVFIFQAYKKTAFSERKGQSHDPESGKSSSE